jgi:hypothetical protein
MRILSGDGLTIPIRRGMLDARKITILWGRVILIVPNTIQIYQAGHLRQLVGVTLTLGLGHPALREQKSTIFLAAPVMALPSTGTDTNLYSISFIFHISSLPKESGQLN